MSTDEDMKAYARAMAVIQPALHGLNPDVQGAVLADLLALWLAGHPKQVRKALLREHVFIVKKLTVANAGMLYAGRGHPQDESEAPIENPTH